MLARLRVGQWLALTIGILLAFAITGIGLALIANHRLDDQRSVVLDQIEPALLAALNLENALINEETGVRGYILSADPRSLEPYEKGLQIESGAYRTLERHNRVVGSTLSLDIRSVRSRAQAWQTQFVTPTLRIARVVGKRSTPSLSPASDSSMRPGWRSASSRRTSRSVSRARAGSYPTTRAFSKPCCSSPPD